MKYALSLFFILGLLLNWVAAQSKNSVSVLYLQPVVYKIKNTISHNFYENENGNLILRNSFGAGIQYNRLILTKHALFLRTGLDYTKGNFELPYVARFNSIKSVSNRHDFAVEQTNLKIGLHKRFSYLSDRLAINLGVDLFSRSMKSNGTRSFTDQDITSVQQDTVLFAFNAFEPTSGGLLGLELNGNVQIKIFEKWKLQIEIAAVPRQKIGFSYDITAVQAYTLDEVFYKFVNSAVKTNNELSINKFRLGFGLNWSF